MNVGSDFILVGLLDGQVYLEFNNIGGLGFQSVTARSQLLYNDGEVHQLNFTFNAGQFQLLLDNANVSVESKWQSIIVVPGLSASINIIMYYDAIAYPRFLNFHHSYISNYLLCPPPTPTSLTPLEIFISY